MSESERERVNRSDLKSKFMINLEKEISTEEINEQILSVQSVLYIHGIDGIVV